MSLHMTEPTREQVEESIRLCETIERNGPLASYTQVAKAVGVVRSTLTALQSRVEELENRLATRYWEMVADENKTRSPVPASPPSNPTSPSATGSKRRC